MLKFIKFTVYIHFREPQTSDDYDANELIPLLCMVILSWAVSSPAAMLAEALRPMKDMAQVTNIVCIGHGSLWRGHESIIQHLAACSIAKELTIIYEEAGRPLNAPIQIFAQDPDYTENDKRLLSCLNPPIRVINDPEGFLAIDQSTLVMSCYPTVPIKQIIGDLAVAMNSCGPAALLLNNADWDTAHGGVDVVTYQWADIVYFSNPGSQRATDMLGHFHKILDIKELFGVLGQDDNRDEADGLNHIASKDNSKTSTKGLDGKPNGLTVKDTDDTHADMFEVSNPCQEIGNDAQANEGDLMDSAVELPGFDWLESMELWVRVD